MSLGTEITTLNCNLTKRRSRWANRAEESDESVSLSKTPSQCELGNRNHTHATCNTFERCSATAFECWTAFVAFRDILPAYMKYLLAVLVDAGFPASSDAFCRRLPALISSRSLFKGQLLGPVLCAQKVKCAFVVPTFPQRSIEHAAPPRCACCRHLMLCRDSARKANLFKFHIKRRTTCTQGNRARLHAKMQAVLG